MSLTVRTVTEVRIDRDTRADEMRTVRMFSRWRPDIISGGRGIRNHDNRHPGERALNTFMDGGPVTAAMALRLADWVDQIEAWATSERDYWQAEAVSYEADGVTVDQQPAPGSIGNPLVMANVIVESRNECLADVMAFRAEILEPLLAAYAPGELDAAAADESERAENQARRAEKAAR